MIQFEWDNNKNLLNVQKHNVHFKEACTVFYDDNALILNDDEHSNDEERFIIIGFSLYTRVLTVCHCYRIDNSGEEVIRIISARKATKDEMKEYEEANKNEGTI